MHEMTSKLVILVKHYIFFQGMRFLKVVIHVRRHNITRNHMHSLDLSYFCVANCYVSTRHSVTRKMSFAIFIFIFNTTELMKQYCRIFRHYLLQEKRPFDITCFLSKKLHFVSLNLKHLTMKSIFALFKSSFSLK